MNLTLALLCWLAALLVALRGGPGRVLLGLLGALALTLSGAEPAAMDMEPAAAFLCVWLLILLPLLRRRLDADALRASGYQGLVALAAVVLSVQSATLLLPALPAEPLLAAAAVLLPFSLLSFAGLALCLLGAEQVYPWEYPAWTAGWLLVLAPSLPLPLPLLAWGQGLGALALTYLAAALLYPAVQRGAALWGWGLSALLAPLALGLLFSTVPAIRP